MAGARPSDPLFDSTLRTQARPGGRELTTLPTLTILAHPSTARMGQRASLSGLLAGNAAEVSRVQPTFRSPQPSPQEQPEPLADPHLSRQPFRVQDDSRGALRIEANGVELVVEGAPLVGSRVLSAQELALGVVIEVAQRVVLLLHMCSQRPLTALPTLIGQSDAVEDLRRELIQVASFDTPVLLRGETGTGKELAAAVIHERSARAGQPYVAINMAAVPEAVAVSTLFGHARGAFTGAHQRHVGFFEQASGGTLLLDEIGETPASVQPTLLRVLETRRVLPLGEERERRVDIRFIAATDADLEQGLADQSFSAALLHRLAGYEVHLPPLRERREDIPLLLMHFIALEQPSVTRARLDELMGAMVSSGFLGRLLRNALPGNVRQLRNIARHLVISNSNRDAAHVGAVVERQLRAIAPSVPPPASVPPQPEAKPARSTKRASERPSARMPEISDEQLLQALREHGYSPNRAAASLGLPTGSIHDLMRRSPLVRRAADLTDDEVQRALAACEQDLQAAAQALCVSERALRITLKHRGMAAPE